MGVGCRPRVLGVGWHGPPVGRWVPLAKALGGFRGHREAAAGWEPKHRSPLRSRRRQGRSGLERAAGEAPVTWDPEVHSRFVRVSGHYRRKDRVGDDRAAYSGRIEAATTWVLSSGPRGAGVAPGGWWDRAGGDDEVAVGGREGVDSDSEGPPGCWGGKQSKTTKSPPCRPVSLAGLVEVGGLLALCHTKSAGVRPPSRARTAAHVFLAQTSSEDI